MELRSAGSVGNFEFWRGCENGNWEIRQMKTWGRCTVSAITVLQGPIIPTARLACIGYKQDPRFSSVQQKPPVCRVSQGFLRESACVALRRATCTPLFSRRADTCSGLSGHRAYPAGVQEPPGIR